MHWWNGYDHMGWMGLWWVLGAALIAFVIWAFLRASRGPPTALTETPEDIVKRRYSKGEIDRDTYERMLGDLRH